MSDQLQEINLLKLEIKSLEDAGKVVMHPDNHLEEITVINTLQYLDGPERVRFMEEAYRILEPEGKITITVPYYNSMKAFQDPWAKWPPFTESFFGLFNAETRKMLNETHEIKCDFDYSYGYNGDPSWAMRNQEAKDFAIRHYTNIVVDLIVTLTKRK